MKSTRAAETILQGHKWGKLPRPVIRPKRKNGQLPAAQVEQAKQECIELLCDARLGCKRSLVAAYLDLTVPQISLWLSQDAEFNAAWKAVEQMMIDTAEAKLFHSAIEDGDHKALEKYLAATLPEKYTPRQHLRHEIDEPISEPGESMVQKLKNRAKEAREMEGSSEPG